MSIVIPARDEAPTVGAVVRAARRAAPTADVVVVDDGSTDDTAAEAERAGARVVPSDGSGKGAALWTGLRLTNGVVVVFLDADVTNPRPDMVERLLAHLEADPALVMVKAAYRRPHAGQAGEGGRVTELVARPTISLLFPALAHIRQPLAGEVAARRTALELVPFVDGYGVDIGLLLDLAARFGASAIGQVDLGERAHRNRPLSELTPMATEVLRVALDRAGVLDAAAAPPSERPPVALLLP